HVLDGQRRFVVVEGEAGSGKSRLAAQFAVEAHAEGAVVMWGRSTTEAIVPYEPMVEALRTVLRTVSPEARQRVVTGRHGLAMMLVIGTVRLTPAVDNPALDALLGDLRRDIILKRIRLGGLGEPDVAELLGADGRSISPAHAAAVHRATRGNAFFVTELAHHA